jgi:FHA domain
MARLVFTSGAVKGREFILNPGSHQVGRGADNTFTIPDPSVSTHHCEITVSDRFITVRDLGSTNGTFINEAPVIEAILHPGQTVRFGDVGAVFETTNELVSAPASAPTESILQATPVFQSPGAPPPPAFTATPPPILQPTPAPVESSGPPQNCKHHPKTPGRYHCPKCSHYYCDACISIRRIEGKQTKLCRHCGVECTPVQVQLRIAEPVGFFKRLPGAFAYPLRGSGVILLVVGTFLLVLMKAGAKLMVWGNIRLFVYGIILQIILGGYLYAFMQNVVQTTATEDEEMPDLPGVANVWEDILLPCCQFLGMVLMCFGPAMVLWVWAKLNDDTGIKIAQYVAFAFGCIYYPMAFLAVTVLDSVAAANPLLVASSILRVLKEYLATLVLLGGVLLLRLLGDFTVNKLFPNSWDTQSMKELFGMVGLRSVWSLFSFFLLIVSIRILGLLFVTKKDDLGWLGSRN